MNNFELVARIERKSKALKHCNKLLDKIDKDEKALVPLNCTGVVLEVIKGDPVYLRLKAIRAQLVVEINSLEITQRTDGTQPAQITVSSEVFDKPAFEEKPTESSPTKNKRANLKAMTEEELIEHKRRQWREYARHQREKHKNH